LHEGDNVSVTIKDVANAAGVSPSTVSRVINKKGVISPETEEKIFAVMKELNYIPNKTARSFASGSTMAIALIIDVADVRAYSNNFFNNSVFGIETVAHQNGYDLIITNGRRNDIEGSMENIVLSKKVDGIILPETMVKTDFLRKLDEMDFPYVILGQPPVSHQWCNWVDINNVQGGALAVEHLLDKGYRKIAFLSSGEKEVFNRNRIKGYQEALNQKQMPLFPDYIRHCQSSVESGLAIAKEMLTGENPPDAFICSDYYLGIGVKRAVAQVGLTIPSDIGLIFFDNSPVAELIEPSITTVDIDTLGLGQQAASILISKITDKQLGGRQTLIGTKIIERESTQRVKENRI